MPAVMVILSSLSPFRNFKVRCASSYRQPVLLFPSDSSPPFFSVQLSVSWIRPVSLREKAIFIVQRLRQEGYESYLAGGCVRDMLLHKSPQRLRYCYQRAA